jgi:hypothetical protein|tara:strand:+ start:607 stop:786 length:180 start_codon:yes stop_codon:yes gene_type:complete
MDYAEIAKEKRTKFLELLRELDAPASAKTELINAFFNSDSAAWKDGFEAANAINDKIKC